MRARGLLVLVLGFGACGRVGFDPPSAASDAAADGSSDGAAPDPDLIAHFPFEAAPESTPDVAGLLAPGTCVPPRCPTRVAGLIGMAYAFDGIDDYVQFTSMAALDFGATSQAFSIAIWYRANGLVPPTQRVLMAQSTDAGSVSYQLSFEPIQAGAPLDLVWKVCQSDCQSGVFPVASDLDGLDRWTLVVGVWDGTEARLYVDAVLVAATPKSTIVYDGFPFMVGADYEAGGSIEDSFDGLIDDLRIYRRALSVADQMDLRAAALP